MGVRTCDVLGRSWDVNGVYVEQLVYGVRSWIIVCASVVKWNDLTLGDGANSGLNGNSFGRMK